VNFQSQKVDKILTLQIRFSDLDWTLFDGVDGEFFAVSFLSSFWKDFPKQWIEDLRKMNFADFSINDSAGS
jgi:hypothetical protein